ncbi:MAG: hypothetical protein MJ139_02635 [Limosilactobacillus sp.]|nr:hypothetical protein [Limosilactobacillus sp.]
MNQELKQLLKVSFTMLTIFILIINGLALMRTQKLTFATNSSVIIQTNRLKHPNINHPSATLPPHRLPSKSVQLIAMKHQHKLYVVSHHRVIYITHAYINHQAGRLTIHHPRGQQLAYHRSSLTASANNWISLGGDNFISAPAMINGHPSAKNWLKMKQHLPHTIEVSKPDALLLQQLPQGTTIRIKE